jgi:hypothetical protein
VRSLFGIRSVSGFDSMAGEEASEEEDLVGFVV